MIWVGTSGFQYPEWKGTFYPATLSTAKMLPFYAGHFPTTEINYSFYRIPSVKTLNDWAAATPLNFRFTLKAPREITHIRKLRDTADVLDRFREAALTLREKLGILLFQLPPFLKKDLPLLNAFLNELPKNVKSAFEFRHPSWFDDEVFDSLRARNLALCVADSEKLKTPLAVTADYGYFRLRDEGYTSKDIRRWSDVIAEHQSHFKDIYVYFTHEESGTGPKFAKELMKNLAVEMPRQEFTF